MQVKTIKSDSLASMYTVISLKVPAVGLPVSDELENLDEELAQSFPPYSALQLHLIAAEKTICSRQV